MIKLKFVEYCLTVCMHKFISKIGLGTAQWGLNYGVSNDYGLTPPDEVRRILDFAKSCGISTIDTAPVYGASEKVIGANDISGFNLCTKLPALRDMSLGSNVNTYFQSSTVNSIQNLRSNGFEYLLLHDCNDLLGVHGSQVALSMKKFKESGISKKIGFSAYTSSQIHSALDFFKPDVVQIPFSIFDQRLFLDGTLNILKDLGIEIHARSIFLQGLLLMPPNKLDQYFAPFLPSIRNWHDICNDLDLLPLELALYFVISRQYIDKVIIGISNLCQLNEIISSIEVDQSSIADFPFSKLAHTSEKLLNPSIWALNS